MTTTDLSDFGHRELGMLEQLLCAMRTQGLPNDFEDYNVTPVMNQCSGDVFLSNAQYQIAMMNGGKLESFYTLSSVKKVLPMNSMKCFKATISTMKATWNSLSRFWLGTALSMKLKPSG